MNSRGRKGNRLKYCVQGARLLKLLTETWWSSRVLFLFTCSVRYGVAIWRLNSSSLPPFESRRSALGGGGRKGSGKTLIYLVVERFMASRRARTHHSITAIGRSDGDQQLESRGQHESTRSHNASPLVALDLTLSRDLKWDKIFNITLKSASWY